LPVVCCRLPSSLFTVPCCLITAPFRIGAGWALRSQGSGGRGRLGVRKQGEPDWEAVFFPRLAARALRSQGSGERAEWPEARRVAVAADEQPVKPAPQPLVEPVG